jgi:hypothetical protein
MIPRQCFAGRVVVRVLVAVLPLLCVRTALALINPNYTPVDLANQTAAIVRLELTGDGRGNLKMDAPHQGPHQAAMAERNQPVAGQPSDRTQARAVPAAELREAADAAGRTKSMFLANRSQLDGNGNPCPTCATQDFTNDEFHSGH